MLMAPFCWWVPVDVRFRGKSGHHGDLAKCPLLTHNGHRQRCRICLDNAALGAAKGRTDRQGPPRTKCNDVQVAGLNQWQPGLPGETNVARFAGPVKAKPPAGVSSPIDQTGMDGDPLARTPF
jgi:hypothetical protein